MALQPPQLAQLLQRPSAPSSAAEGETRWWSRWWGSSGRSQGFTDRGRALLVGGILLSAAGLLLGFPDLTRIGVATVAMTCLADLLTWRRRPQLEVHRTLSPAPLMAGHGGRVLLRLRNIGPRGSDPLAAAEYVSPWLGSTTRLVLPPLRPDAETVTSYEVRPTRRGRHRAGPLTVVSRDALGLTHRAAAVGEPLDVLVLPPVHDLSAGDPTGLGLGHEGDAPANVLTGTEHDASVREYRQGDDQRRVHWGVTAHRGRLMVRHEALPRLRRAVLVLDASAAVWQDDSALDVPDGCTSAFEWAVEALASVAAHLSALDFTLHLLLAGARRGTEGTGDSARAWSLDEVLARLAVVEPGSAVPTGSAAGMAAGDARAEPGAPVPWNVTAAAREVAGAGGVVVLVTGDRLSGSAHETFSLLRTGLAGLAMVVDTDAFARVATHPQGGRGSPGLRASGAANPLSEGGAANPLDEAGAEAGRLCAHARSGGWRAVAVVPSMSPATAWSRLLGSTRGWSAPATDEAAPHRTSGRTAAKTAAETAAETAAVRQETP